MNTQARQTLLRRATLLLSLFLSAALPGMAANSASKKEITPRFDPVEKSIEGWTVWVEPVLLPGGAEEEKGERALKMLANHLQRISILVPEEPLKKLKEYAAS